MDAKLPEIAVAEHLAEHIAALEAAKLPAAVRTKCDELLIDVGVQRVQTVEARLEFFDVSRARRRNPPIVARRTVDKDSHPLAAAIDMNDDRCLGTSACSEHDESERGKYAN